MSHTRAALLAAAASVMLAAAGCGWFEHSALLDPYAAAPPSSAEQWKPPAPMDTYRPAVNAWRQTAGVLPDPGRVYDLSDLIGIAQQANPETRQAWEKARSLAALAGRAESGYLPNLTVGAQGGITQDYIQTPSGNAVVHGPVFTPQLELTWLLLDFGRRGAEVDLARQTLLEANFRFNRKLQDIVYAVQRSFYALDAARAMVTAAMATLETAQAIQEAVEARKDVGLSTKPEVLLARQETARAALDVERARGDVMDAQAALAESIGVPPSLPLQISDLSAQTLPTHLPEAVDAVMDSALKNRPDLAARLAALRAREAEERRARAEYLPELWATGGLAQDIRHYRSGPPFNTFNENDTLYAALLNFEWPLFQGFDRVNAVRQAESARNSAQAELAAMELQTLREVWQAYADVKTALRKYDFALALLAASDEAYESNLEAYRHGLSDIIDLLTAQRDLARARTAVIESKAELLTSSATLAFTAGELPAEH